MLRYRWKPESSLSDEPWQRFRSRVPAVPPIAGTGGPPGVSRSLLPVWMHKLRPTILAQHKWAASDECRIFSSHCRHFNWNSIWRRPWSAGLTVHCLYVSGKSKNHFFSESKPSQCSATSKTPSVSITLQTNSNTQ